MTQVKIVPLLDVHQLLMLSAGTLTCSDPETISSLIFIICSNCCCYWQLASIADVLKAKNNELNSKLLLLLLYYYLCYLQIYTYLTFRFYLF
jgi:hypothetical protein